MKFGITCAGREGDIAINALAKDVPILVSKKVLKKLGAIVDCDTGVAVFVKLAPDVPVQLEESPGGGHYYMSLVDDFLDQRVRDPARLQNFRTICRHLQGWAESSAAAGQDSEPEPQEHSERGGLEKGLPPSAPLFNAAEGPHTGGSPGGERAPVERRASGWA